MSSSSTPTPSSKNGDKASKKARTVASGDEEDVQMESPVLAVLPGATIDSYWREAGGGDLFPDEEDLVVRVLQLVREGGVVVRNLSDLSELGETLEKGIVQQALTGLHGERLKGKPWDSGRLLFWKASRFEKDEESSTWCVKMVEEIGKVVAVANIGNVFPIPIEKPAANVEVRYLMKTKLGPITDEWAENLLHQSKADDLVVSCPPK